MVHQYVNQRGKPMQRITVQTLKDTHVQSRSRKRSLHRSRSSEDVDIAQNRDHDSIRTRCDLYLSLAAAYLVLICSIASTTNSDYHSPTPSLRTAVLILSSLSFVLTITLGMLSAYNSSAQFGITSSKTVSRKPPRRFTTLEHIVTPFISMFTCIASGMILYPQYDDDVILAEVAVKVNEVWNANLFYFSYICLYGSTYLMAKVFAQNGTTGASTRSSIRILLSMAIFSSICNATSLMVMRHGPECNGYLDLMPYCSHSLTAVILSTLCTVLSVLLCVATGCLELYHSRGGTRHSRSSSKRMRDLQRSKTLLYYKLILAVGTTLFVLLQFATYVTIVSSSSGGPSVILTSWIACMFSLLLWTTSCSQLQRMHQQDATVNERKKVVMNRLLSSTDTTTTEEYPNEPKIGNKFVRTPVQPQQQIHHSQLQNHRQNKSPQHRNVAQADTYANYVFSSSLEHTSLRDAQKDLLLRQASSHLQASKSYATRPQREGRSKEKNGNIQSHRDPSLEHVVLEEQKPISYVKKEVKKQRRPDPLGNTSVHGNNISNPSRRIIRETRVNKTHDNVSVLPSNIDNNGQELRIWPPPPPSTPPPSRRRHISRSGNEMLDRITSANVQGHRCHNSRSRDEMLDRIPTVNVQDAKSPPTTEYVSSSSFVNTVDHRRMHHSSITMSRNDSYSTSSSLFSLPVTADPSERSKSYQTSSNNMSNVLSPLPELSPESSKSVKSQISLPVTADPSKRSISHPTSNNISNNLSTKFAESSRSLNLSGVFASNCSSKDTLDKKIAHLGAIHFFRYFLNRTEVAAILFRRNFLNQTVL